MKIKIKTKKWLIILAILGVLLTPSITYALFGGFDIGVQLKLLAETVEQTLHLKDIIAFTKRQVKDVSDTLHIIKDVNRDINEIKNYNLDKLSGDLFDLTVGGVSGDIDDLSGYIKDKRFIDGEESGRIKKFFKYVWGEEPTAQDSPVKIKLFANTHFAIKSFEDVDESYNFTYNIRKLYEHVVDDVKYASPGRSEQIGAQLQAVNTLQFSKIQDNQAGLLKLKSVDLINRSSESRQASQQTFYMFGGIGKVFQKIKEERKE